MYIEVMMLPVLVLRRQYATFDVLDKREVDERAERRWWRLA